MQFYFCLFFVRTEISTPKTEVRKTKLTIGYFFVLLALYVCYHVFS